MAADVQGLLARMAAQREQWVPLGGARAVCIRRPLELELVRLRQPGAVAEFVVSAACNWRGFTEADLLGAADGSDAPVAFATELWAEWVRDRSDAMASVSTELVNMVTRHFETRAAAAKN